MRRVPTERDWVDAVERRLPVSPLSALGLLLVATIGLRVAAQALSRQALLESVFPLLAATAVVLADRWLLARDVSARDRFSVFAYALGGFLAASLVTGLHLSITTIHGAALESPLYLTLLSGTVGVAAGTVAGLYESRQRAAVREARRQSARLEEFASIVSHDLRNPLAVARSKLAETYRTGDPGHLRAVDDALERMDERIEESLSVARSGRHVDEPEQASLLALAEEAWATVETGDATLETGTDRPIRVDRSRAKTLLENCFRNAVEHGSSGPSAAAEGENAVDRTGGGLTVRVGALPRGFFVEDDGPGIAPERRSRVLEHGFSTAEEGSGLGLAIVRAVADAHGWDVRVAESDAGGARFEFTRG